MGYNMFTSRTLTPLMSAREHAKPTMRRVLVLIALFSMAAHGQGAGERWPQRFELHGAEPE